jgi:adenylosuccinate synthase
MPCTVVVGMQWGDEGKGKIVDFLSQGADLILRGQGGSNAGHTIMIGNEEYRFHLVPSGILFPHIQGFIGGGTVIDPQILLREIDLLEAKGISVKGRLFISAFAHLVFPYHKLLDELSEERKKAAALGTTRCGIGPCYSDRVNRIGMQMGEFVREELFEKKLHRLLEIKNRALETEFHQKAVAFEEIYPLYREYAERLRPFVAPVEEMIDEAILAKKKVLLEGAQGTLLDVNFGTYPFVTSSSTLASGICAGGGVGPTRIDHTLGVLKAYITRVGSGPLPTALTEEEGSRFLDHRRAREIGTTTGRKRRIGWFDAVLGRFAVRLNAVDSLAITKLDVLDNLPTLKICSGYRLGREELKTPPSLVADLEKVEPIYETLPGWQSSTRGITTFKALPKAAQNYLERISELLKTQISLVSLGPERHHTLFLQKLF